MALLDLLHPVGNHRVTKSYIWAFVTSSERIVGWSPLKKQTMLQDEQKVLSAVEVDIPPDAHSSVTIRFQLLIK